MDSEDISLVGVDHCESTKVARKSDDNIEGAQGLTDGKNRGHERGSILDTMGHELHRAIICSDVSDMQLGLCAKSRILIIPTKQDSTSRDNNVRFREIMRLAPSK